MQFLRVAAFLLGSLFVFSCSERAGLIDVISPNGVAFIPRFAMLGGGSIEPIVTIRLTARSVATSQVIAVDTIRVNPDDDEWNIGFEVPGNAAPFVVLIELLNAAGEVEWSAIAGPIDLRAGTRMAPHEVVVTRGPAGNLGVSSVVLTPSAAAVVEGATVALQATLVDGGPGARAFFSTLDPSVATVDQNGVVTTLRNGTARIVAEAGPQADTSVITVAQRVATVRVAPDSQRIATLGAEATFTAQALDPRGAPVAGATITWSSEDAAIAEHIGAGTFRARANGRTQVIATSSSTPLVRGSATIAVAQHAAGIALTPEAAVLNSIGGQQRFNAEVRDANGNVMPGAPLTWRSTSTAVATIDQNGLATALSHGRTEIVVVAGAGTPDSVVARATLQVILSVQTITVVPSGALLEAAGDTVRFSATARDASGGVIPDVEFTWSSSVPGVAPVDATGLARAASSGVTLITATAGSVTGSQALAVDQIATVASLTPVEATLSAIGQTVQLSVVAEDRNGNSIVNPELTWSSDEAGIATVDATGLVTAVGNGTTTIRIALRNATAFASITVAAASDPVVSRFDADAESWTTAGDATGFTWLATGGNPGGHLRATDQGAGITWFFQAPAAFLGNMAAFIDRTLTFDLKQSATDSQYADALVVLTGAGITLMLPTPYNPATNWTSYQARLNETGGWRVGALDGPLATRAQIEQVLAALTVLRIRGEFISGPDTGFLDNVVFGATEDLDPAPNLVVASLNVIPADTIVEGDSVTVALKIRNVGSVPAGPSTTALLGIDAATGAALPGAAYAVPTPALPPGDSLVAAVRVRLDTAVAWPDSVRVMAVVDAANVIAESNEGDNSLATGVRYLRFRTTSVVITPDSLELTSIGDLAQLTAQARDRNGRVLNRPIEWSINANPEEDGSAISLDTAGTVVALRNGVAEVVATSGDRADTAFVRVLQAADSIAITAEVDSLDARGAYTTYGATAWDARGNIAAHVVFGWASSDTTVATVDEWGTVVAQDDGTAQITASANGVSTSHRIVVVRALASFNIERDGEALDTLTTLSGSTVALQAVARDPLESELAVAVTWASRNTGVATVDASGHVTAVAVGQTVVAAMVDGNPQFGDSVVVKVIGPIAGITKTWAGTTSSWSTASNWLPEGAPGASDVVWIPVRSQYPALPGNTTLAGIVVDTSAFIEIGANTLTLSTRAFIDGDVGRANGGSFALAGSGGTYRGNLPPVHVTAAWSGAGRTTITGDLTMATGANFSAGGHTVDVTGALTLECNGFLTMNNTLDSLRVAGSVSLNRCDGSVPTYSAGVLEVGGDFNTGSNSREVFRPSGSHTVVLNGTGGMQRVSLGFGHEGNHWFRNLLITNPDSVRFDSQVYVDSVRVLAGRVVGDHRAHVRDAIVDVAGGRWRVSQTRGFGPTLRLPLSLNTDLLFDAGVTTTLVNGFRVNGRIDIAGNANTNLVLNGNAVVVGGDFNWNCNGLLTMNQAADDLTVLGSFYANRCDGSTPNLSNGVLRVAGHFTVDGNSREVFRPTFRHKVILNGTGVQNVSHAFGHEGNHWFRYLEIANPDTVRFNSQIFIDDTAKVTTGNVVGTHTAHIRNVLIDAAGDRWRPNVTRFFGTATTTPANMRTNLLFNNDVVTLQNGFRLIGNIEISGGGGSVLVLNGHSVTVQGNLNWTCNGFLQMSNAADQLNVSGNFSANRCDGATPTLNAGVLRVGGDFTTGGNSREVFRASGTHKVVLDGDGTRLQQISHGFGHEGNHWFRNLEISNPAPDSVVFTSQIFVTDTAIVSAGLVRGTQLAHIGKALVDVAGDRWQLTRTRFYGPQATMPAKLTTNLVFNNNETALQSDFRVIGNVELSGTGATNLVLNGHVMTVQGSFSWQCNGLLTMSNDADELNVTGSFSANRCDGSIPNLSKGILRVGGDFTTGSNSREVLRTSGTHRIVLNGAARQNVSLGFGHERNHWIRHLEVDNADTVNFASQVPVTDTLTITNGIVTGAHTAHLGHALIDPVGDRWQVMTTRFYGATAITPAAFRTNLLFSEVGTETRLANDFRVIGDMTIQGTSGTNVVMNGREVTVQGNFSWECNGMLTMNDEADLLIVTGNFSANRCDGAVPTLSAGTMRVSGNFSTGSNSREVFRPTGTHRVALNGTDAQTIHLGFGHEGNHWFRHLDITNPTAVTFNTITNIQGDLENTGAVLIPEGRTVDVFGNLAGPTGVFVNFGTLKYGTITRGTTASPNPPIQR